MKPSAIYSKSGKGVQEASGKTSLLKRGDRAVLSAIDGRATLGEVAHKVGKSFDAEFEKLIAMLDKEGFVREVATAASASASASSASRPAVNSGRAPAAKPAAPAASSGGVDDLDFTSIMPAIKQPIRAPSPPKPAPPDSTATQRAKEQEAALYKARQEAEARAQAERDRHRQEAEAKARSEAEAKLRAETEKKIREEADRKAREEADAKAKAARQEAEAKANAAREAALRLAAEAKARAEAEAKAKIEAERRAREEAERKAREEAEKARREAEELRQRLEEERRAREEAERQRKEEEERRRREEEERRVREEAERRAREEAERKLEEERRAREEAERKAREEEERRLKEEEARLAREAEIAREQQARELEEARSRVRSRDLDEERARRAQKETQTRQPTLPSEPPPAPAMPFGGGSLDALMADLDSFSQREEEERRARDAVEGASRDERKRRAAEESERRAAEEAERQAAAAQELERQRVAEEARRRQEEERRAQEEAERKREQERRAREAEEARRAEEEARKRRETAKGRKPADTDIELGDADLGMDDVRRDQAAVARETRKAQRERERETRKRMQEAKSRAQAVAREAPVKYPKARRPVKWGRPLAITFFVALVAAIGLLHVMPLPMADYEAAASEALGRPVRIGSGHLSLFTGVRLNLANVTVGDSVRIAEARAYPRIGSLFDERKAFSRIELNGVAVPQQSIGAAVAARLAGRTFEVERILASNVRLEGPVPLPVLEAEARVASDGTLRSLDLRGPESLDIKLSSASNGEVEFDVTAHSLTVPFVPDLVLSSFAMKGSANRQGMKIASWGGAALGGVLSGSANVRWSSAWQVDGTMTARSINAAVFAPALLSEGKAEGSARFSMSGPDPAKLHQVARMEGDFAVGKGALGTFDLSRLLQTGGRQHGGRTQFTEMTGHARYDRGAVALRNINISAGALTAGASADIAPGGALAGQIVADVRTTLQPLRATLVVGGTVKDPQVRN